MFRFSLALVKRREPFDVHVEFLAVLRLVQTLLHAVQKLPSGSQPSPSGVSFQETSAATENHCWKMTCCLAWKPC